MAEMISLDRAWTLSAAAEAGRDWLASVFARQRTRLAGLQPRLTGSEESGQWLEERILATRTDIAAINRSLAMQKQALEGTWSGRNANSVPAPRGSRPTTPATPDLPLEDNGSAYADTEPMPLQDTTPAPAATAGQ